MVRAGPDVLACCNDQAVRRFAPDIKNPPPATVNDRYAGGQRPDIDCDIRVVSSEILDRDIEGRV